MKIISPTLPKKKNKKTIHTIGEPGCLIWGMLLLGKWGGGEGR